MERREVSAVIIVPHPFRSDDPRLSLDAIFFTMLLAVVAFILVIAFFANRPKP